TLGEPFLQLAFLALPVIPALKITDRGMVDVTRFEIIAGSHASSLPKYPRG
ncbi:MAG: adenine deaminase C-terminal domain-containing protein, partial [Paracoccus sp. (in: a-proteobacteria)]|nr:adenine deaminase C-terminal domain-containing protein [Paracoccus sp. (in: a-proteobacteria)]